jgi:hypothetical protein
MMQMARMHSMTRARMLGHRRFHRGALPLAEDALSERNSEVVAGVRSSSSAAASPWSLRSSLASSGVCSVVLLEACDCREREERVDFCEVGRELGVRVEPHGPSGVSMVVRCGWCGVYEGIGRRCVQRKGRRGQDVVRE